MLETQPNMIVSGGLYYGGEVCPIYVNVETGDCAFETPTTGEPILIGEISIDSVKPVESYTQIVTNLKHMEKYAIGYILIGGCTDAYFILDENTAVRRSILSPETGGTPISISMDADYEIDD